MIKKIEILVSARDKYENAPEDYVTKVSVEVDTDNLPDLNDDLPISSECDDCERNTCDDCCILDKEYDKLLIAEAHRVYNSKK